MNNRFHNRKELANMSHSNTNPISFDSLEARTLFSVSVAPTVAGYLPDYHYAALHSQGSPTLDRVNWGALTQINYFSVVPDAATGALPGTVPTPGADPLPAVSSGNYSLDQLSEVVTEAHAHHVKVSIVVGGSGYDASLTTIAADSDLQLNFAKSVQAFATKYHVDGVDLDWELQHPTLGQIDAYGDLIETLKNNTTGLKISAAVYPERLSIATTDDPTGGAYTTFAWQLSPKAIANLDQIGIMDYDLDYADHSPIGRTETDMDNWAAYLTDNHVLPSKLLFGIPFYGKAGDSWNWHHSDSVAYNTLIDTYNAANTTPADQNLDQVTAQLSTILPSYLTQVWHFNSVSEVQTKTQYAITKGFGGVMAWDIGMDHLTGANVNDDQYSLLAAIGRTVASNFPTAPQNTNFTDLVAVAQHYGMNSGATLDQGDFNGDGKVDFADLVYVAQHYSTNAAAPIAPITTAAYVAPTTTIVKPKVVSKSVFSVTPVVQVNAVSRPKHR